MDKGKTGKFDGLVQDPVSSGLLISVIRTLTSSASDDQRQLERSRLEKGFEQSGLVIDRLLTEHRSDVTSSLSTFRSVSNGITSCRERIQNTKNALHTCKSLLQCRRDDLKNLWMESAEQTYINNTLQQIYEIKHLDQTVEASMDEAKFREAVDILKKADILLNGPLSQIDGLSQLRSNITDTSQVLFERIVQDLLQLMVVVPFDAQILNLMHNIDESSLNESPTCVALIDKYAPHLPHSPTATSTSTHQQSSVIITHSLIPNILLNNPQRKVDQLSTAAPLSNGTPTEEDTATRLRVEEDLEALKVFDQLTSAVEQFFLRTNSLGLKALNDTISVAKLLVKDGLADSTHLSQLIQVVIAQMRSSAARFSVVVMELQRLRLTQPVGVAPIMDPTSHQLYHRFWELLQNLLESIVSDHLGIWRNSSGPMALSSASTNSTEPSPQRKVQLFSFENTSFVSSANSSLLKKKQLNLVCPSTPYNVTSIFHALNTFCAEIEKQLSSKQEPQCRMAVYLHSYVMESFIERVRTDMEKRTEQALSGGQQDVWSSLSTIPTHNVKILTSCLRIFELCQQISDFILSMGTYTQRFVSLWLLIIAHFTKSASDMYAQITRTRSHQGESLVEFPKISAAWAVDEDISRMLKSLPSWTAISQCTPTTGPGSGAMEDHTPMMGLCNESEQEIRLRTERETEILIGNLGAQRQIQRTELITDMEHIRALVCMHESLQWFASNMRTLIRRLPVKAKEILKCRIQICDSVNGQTVEQLLSEALEERLASLEGMSETCLLMVYLEVRVRCFYHLLPLSSRKSSLPQDEQDKEVLEFGRDLIQFHQTLGRYVVPSKLKYLFDGLGHLCSCIFIHSSQYMSKLSETDRKRTIRNIFTVQKYLSQLTGRPESEMQRAQTFYKLVNHLDFDHIFALIKESGESYSYLEYTYLLSLAVRSHPTLSAQPGALEGILNQLKDNLAQINRR